MIFRTRGFIGLILLIIPNLLVSQCAMVPVNLDDRVEHSDIIVEAVVTDQNCFIDQSDNHIYTANHLEVLKLFKGSLQSDEVILITQGGTVGSQGETVFPSLSMQLRNKGIFFLYSNSKMEDNTYKAYSGPQGAIFYDRYSSGANDVFNTYASVRQDVYPAIEKASGISYSVIKELPQTLVQSKAAAPNIDSLSPLSVSAGTKDVLSIYGSGFGATRGTGEVVFRNASTGPGNVSPVDDEYILWSDNLIKVEVPYSAGTGGVRVDKNGTDISALNIRFAQLALTTLPYPIPTVHLDNNGSGGFTWRMAMDFYSNSGAKASYERALATWSDKTCINWSNGPSTTVDADVQDGINNVRFADTGELEAGVLAHTRNYWTNCDASNAFTVEIDLTYDPDKSWYYGSGNPPVHQYDIESISVHELGHAHQLGHVIDLDDFMHATIGPGQTKRDLIQNNIEAGLYVMKQSVVKKKCGPTEMKAKAGCVVPVSVDQFDRDEPSMGLYPNPFNETLNIEVGRMENGIVQIFNMSGQEVHRALLLNSTSYKWDVPGEIPNGLYLIKVSNDHKTIIERAILSH